MTSPSYIVQTSLTTGNLPMSYEGYTRTAPVLRRILQSPLSRLEKVAMIQQVPLLVIHLQAEYMSALLDGRATL